MTSFVNALRVIRVEASLRDISFQHADFPSSAICDPATSNQWKGYNDMSSNQASVLYLTVLSLDFDCRKNREYISKTLLIPFSHNPSSTPETRRYPLIPLMIVTGDPCSEGNWSSQKPLGLNQDRDHASSPPVDASESTRLTSNSPQAPVHQ